MTNNNAPVVSVRNMKKTYSLGQTSVHTLRGISLDIYPGEFVAIMGPSGSGKSTFMNMIGFVFQGFNLLSRATALSNVALPLLYADFPRNVREGRARKALNLVGLGSRLHHKPAQMSGGQQQQVAIARALINSPSLLMADEPTGNLDSRTSLEIMAILQSLNQQGLTIILVTHEPDIAAFARRQVTFCDVRIIRDEPILTPRSAIDEWTMLARTKTDHSKVQVRVA